MPLSCPITGIIHNTQSGPGVEFMARRWAVGVDTATHVLSDFTRERNAARRRIIGTLHAHQFWRQHNRHGLRHTRCIRALGDFRGMKIHPVCGTAGTTLFTDGKR